MPDGILKPDNGNAVAPAKGHELVHFDQPLAVELAADAGIIGIFGIVRFEKSLTVADAADQESVHFDQAGVDFGPVVRLELQVLAAVHQPGQDLVET
jgi:hypothetical protein